MASVWEYILGLGPVAKAVLIILLLFSLATWTVIIYKAIQLFILNKRDKRILYLLDVGERWSSVEAEAMYGGSFLSDVISSISKFSKKVGSREELVDIVLSSIDDARERYESLLVFLAIAGSSSPFIGLFGTVWGIMDAFKGIGKVGGASLALVSRGIADALIATACGLFVAIPSVIFYNVFQHLVKKWARRAENTAIKIVNLIGRVEEKK